MTKAEAISSELRAQPELFASYAARLSEDFATRASGGSLGAITGFQLASWPALVDALSAVAPSQVSEPVETEFGFHILLRKDPPKLETVTGSHIVIGHNDASWLHQTLARGQVPPRTRDEAQELANGLYDSARAAPGQFPALVARYSEDIDANNGGDFGTWSNHEATPFGRQVETLQSLPVGAVAPPIETLLGFEVLMRNPNRPRSEYAMAAIKLTFDPLAEEGSPQSRDSVLAVAHHVAEVLREEPWKFEDLQEEYCCRGVVRWRQGAQFPELDHPLEQLAIGRISPQPVESFRKYLIPKRLDPDTLPKRPVRFVVPSPPHPDVAYLVGRMTPSFARTELQRFAQSAALTLGLKPDDSTRFRELHQYPWQPSLDAAVVQKRGEAFDAFLRDLERVLAPGQYSVYRRLLEQEVAELVLSKHAL